MRSKVESVSWAWSLIRRCFGGRIGIGVVGPGAATICRGGVRRAYGLLNLKGSLNDVTSARYSTLHRRETEVVSIERDGERFEFRQCCHLNGSEESVTCDRPTRRSVLPGDRSVIYHRPDPRRRASGRADAAALHSALHPLLSGLRVVVANRNGR